MTPPLNFSGVPQQPQAMPPYGINQPPQRMPQQPMMYQQFGVVPDSFQGQQPMMVSNAPMMRSGRASLALKNQQLQDQIDTLENQPLPAGGNPVGVGALAVGAAGATAVGASEVAYRWDLDKKLAHEHNGRESQLREPLTDPQIQTITDGVKQAKLQELQQQADGVFNKQHAKAIEKIIKGAPDIDTAIQRQTQEIQQLEAKKQAELLPLEEAKHQALKDIVAPGNTSTLTNEQLKTKVDAINNAKKPNTYDAWASSIKTERDTLATANAELQLHSDSVTKIEEAIKKQKLDIGQKTIEKLEKEAFGEGLFKSIDVKNRTDWLNKAARAYNTQSSGLPVISLSYDIHDDHQPYIDYLEDQVNRKKFDATNPKRGRLGGYLETDFQDWKNNNSRKLVKHTDLATNYNQNKKIGQNLNALATAGENLTEAGKKVKSAEQVLATKVQGSLSEHLDYEQKLEQRSKIATVEQEHAPKAQVIEQKHQKGLDAENKKLEELKKIHKNKPNITLLGTDDIKTVEIEAKQKIATAQANQPKVKVPDLFATDAEAKGFGKAWQSVEKLEADGYKTLAEHSKGAKGIGWKAGALVGVIGAGLTLQQFFAAGKAQEANAAKEAKLAQLRQQQADLGG